MIKPNTFEPTRARTYARPIADRRETWEETVDRVVNGFQRLNPDVPVDHYKDYIQNLKVFPSGRWLWVGGTDFVFKPKNHMASFNCIALNLNRTRDFSDIFDLCCQGCGVGELLEYDNIEQIPAIKNSFEFHITPENEIGTKHILDVTSGVTELRTDGETYYIIVGDSRQGWAKAIEFLIQTSQYAENPSKVLIDLRYVRPAGERIKGFGGLTNPTGLPKMFTRIGEILNGAVGRQLTAEECTLIIDEGAEAVVAGNVRRSAGMKQFPQGHPTLKDKLYSVDEDGNFSIDHKRQALRMSNHTNVYHSVPDYETIRDGVEKQYQTGEGAIQFAPVAIARSNRDILDTKVKRDRFISQYVEDPKQAQDYLEALGATHITHRMRRYLLNPCAEIIGSDFACNLSEVQLVSFDPNSPTFYQDLEEAFTVASEMTCSILKFDHPFEKLEESHKIDPIIGVGLTGWFDFMAAVLGDDWIKWCLNGRQRGVEGNAFIGIERGFLEWFNEIVNRAVTDYCKANDLKRPNRTTTIKPSGTLSLLSGACAGGHPSKSAYYIRRITFRAYDPVALACMKMGYNVVPSQKCLDDEGKLLKDPYDPRVTEWLVEIPTRAAWTRNVKDDTLDTQEMPASAQFDMAMQLQKHYVEHNTSFTIELDEDEIDDVADCIHRGIAEGEYVSFAIMQRARPEQLAHTFPLLPFEPISRESYDELNKQLTDADFDEELAKALSAVDEKDKHDIGTSGCDSETCSL